MNHLDLKGDELVQLLNQRYTAMIKVQAVNDVYGLIYSDYTDYENDKPLRKGIYIKFSYEPSDMTFYKSVCDFMGQDEIAIGTSPESIKGFIKNDVIYIDKL